MDEQSDEVVCHRSPISRQCGENQRQAVARRHVLDGPDIRLLAQEHQREAIWCSTSRNSSVGSVPALVSMPIHADPNQQASAISPHQRQVLRIARTCEVL